MDEEPLIRATPVEEERLAVRRPDDVREDPGSLEDLAGLARHGSGYFQRALVLLRFDEREVRSVRRYRCCLDRGPADVDSPQLGPMRCEDADRVRSGRDEQASVARPLELPRNHMRADDCDVRRPVDVTDDDVPGPVHVRECM